MSQIISHSDQNDKALFSSIERFFSDFDLSKLLLKCNFYKASGFSCVLILKQLFSLIFSGKIFTGRLISTVTIFPLGKTPPIGSSMKAGSIGKNYSCS